MGSNDDDEWMDLEDEALDGSDHRMMWRIPLDNACFVDGVPMVTADYFDYAAGEKDEIARALLAIEGAMLPDRDPDIVQVLFYDPQWEGEAFSTAGIVGIATLGRARLRVETKRSAHTESVRAAVERAAGDRLAHGDRRQEDSFQVVLDDELA